MSDKVIPESLQAKIANFSERRDELTRDEFKEASTRIEFIDQLIIALGWDVNNSAGRPERFKEVLVEPVQETRVVMIVSGPHHPTHVNLRNGTTWAGRTDPGHRNIPLHHSNDIGNRRVVSLDDERLRPTVGDSP